MTSVQATTKTDPFATINSAHSRTAAVASRDAGGAHGRATADASRNSSRTTAAASRDAGVAHSRAAAMSSDAGVDGRGLADTSRDAHKSRDDDHGDDSMQMPAGANANTESATIDATANVIGMGPAVEQIPQRASPP